MLACFRRMISRTSVLTLLVGAALLSSGTGCGTQGDKNRESNKVAIKKFRGSLVTFDERIDESVRAMNRLQSENTFDLDRAYMDFMTQYFNVIADAGTISERAEVMRETGVSYFLVEEKEAKAAGDKNDQQYIEARRGETVPAYEDLQGKLRAWNQEYRLYRAQLHELYRYLNRKVSRERVVVAGPQFEAAKAQAQKLKSVLATASAQAEAVDHAVFPVDDGKKKR